MPRASANISAKFIAQIEISKPLESSASRPADETRPRIVSSSGSPAAASEPKASTRIASVTGQEISSERIIASRLAVLKSLHIPDAPVSETLTSAPPAAFSFDFSASAAATIAVGSLLAPAVTTAVCPSAEMVEPARGATTDATSAFARSSCSTLPTALRKPGSVVVSRSEWIDHHQRRAGEAGEVRLDQLARLHRLGSVGLPAGTGERGLDLRREHAEGDGDDHPCDRDDADVVGRPAAEPTERADRRTLARGDGETGRRGGDAHSPDPCDELVQRPQLVVHRAADLLAEREDALVDDPVMDEGCLLAAAEDADLGQHLEVLGDVLLRGAEGLGQLVDARLAFAQPVEQLDPHRLTEHAEAARDQLDEVIGKGVGHLHARLSSLSTVFNCTLV